MSKHKKKKRHLNHSKKEANTKEEYAIEISPNDLIAGKEEKEDFTTSWFRIPTFSSSQFIGYFALFLSLLSLGFYPFLFGAGGIILGILSIIYGEKTIGYTAVAFGAFSLLFDLIYRLNFF